MSTSVAIVTVLSFVLGLINQAVSQGSLLGGLVKVPPTWLPYLTIAASFVGGAYASLQGVATVNGATIVQALVAGVMALVSAGSGVAMVHHVGTPRRMLAMKYQKPQA